MMQPSSQGEAGRKDSRGRQGEGDRIRRWGEMEGGEDREMGDREQGRDVAGVYLYTLEVG